MKKIVALLTITILVFSCSKDKGNMIVKGQIKGLKKGTLYLQKMKDTLIVSVDSVKLFGDDKFLLSDNVESPEMYYLTFDGNTQEKKLMFFGEQGEITVNDNIEEFGFKPEVLGSKNQEVMDKFNEINKQFILKRLDFIKRDIEARAVKDEEAVTDLEAEYKRLVRKRFLFTTNFAISNKDSEAAPYIALSELFDANIYLLDTINNSLTDRVKASMYGKRLNKFVTDVKEKEGQK
ncbi:uncharacterized protein DUF4369 [Tenacibaculum adriaticum]|uniref:Uncharacterized protein DUF4369 n=1 Tax=Tenacibaculum adriaticum TaxID=413713 RepID=A0A5S5DQ72_9FLAO|nr:DUF4369 domain-containing protein [Tenacibaculum adriaticum]TYP97538.1 uncharacterized protein DUF4369 [Tenacibaculum adriaticum]